MMPVEMRQLSGLGEETILGLERGHAHIDTIMHEVATRLPTRDGSFVVHLYKDLDMKEHLALVKGDVKGKKGVLTRVHSECLTGDLFGSLRCDCGPQLHQSMRMIEESNSGIIIYLRQEGRGIGLVEKLKTYNLQDAGLDTVDANIFLGHRAEERDYSVAAKVIRDLGASSIKLISNNPDKERKLELLGIKVDSRITLEPDVNPENLRYLKTKIERMGHRLEDTQLYPYQPEMDDARRYILRRMKEKVGFPFITIFNISGLDGQLTYEPKLPGRGPTLYKVLRRKLMAVHNSLLITVDDTDLGIEAGNMNLRLLIFDPEMKMRMDHPLLGEEGPETVILHGPCKSPPHSEMEERGIRHFTILDNDGDLDPGAFLNVMTQLEIGSILVDGKDGISDMLLSMGLADTVLNSLVPVMSGTGKVKSSDTVFHLDDVSTVTMGDEVVYYGHPVSN